MVDFFARLFSTEGFPARWKCGDWTDFHGWLYILSDLGVWSAYTAIPAVLIYFVLRKATIPFRRIFLLFGAFILACGLTHLFDALMFWWPAYRLLGLIELATAVISWATVVALVPIVPRALSMRSPEELEREIEARRRAELDLQQANHDLESRIEQRTAELQATDRRKDEFLAMLAHELRNPLAPIRSGLELLSLQNDPKTVEWARELMDRQLRHVVRLVDDLMDVSRITHGKIQLKLQPVELNSVIHQVVEEASESIAERELKLSLPLSDKPIWLRADPIRITQILSNLLGNAVKYTDRGGRIAIDTRLIDDQVAITFSDTGIGIPPELLGQLFLPFGQLNHTASRARGGLGIGLALVRTLVELHGGSVTAHSEGLGKGSQFTVCLPVANVGPQASESERGSVNVAPKRVLIVDDNQAAADSLARLLEKLWNHQVTEAYHAEGIADVVRRVNPDVVFLDIGLPNTSGYEVAQQLRSLPEGAGPLLVALTGYGQPEDRRRSAAAGFDLHLVKPTTIESLEQVFQHPKLAAS